MRRLRWTLARLIAPTRIMPAPIPKGSSGTWLLIYDAGSWITIEADSFRAKMTNGVCGGRGRFVGTIHTGGMTIPRPN